MSILSLVLLPVVGLLIGWTTNKLAIWMLFHPKKPVNILGFKLQGVIPGRQDRIAYRVSEIVASKLIGDGILQSVEDNTEFQENLIGKIMDEMRGIVEEHVGYVGAVWLGKMEEAGVFEATKARAKTMLRDGIKTINEHLDIQALVEQNIMSFDLDELETLVRTIASQEFKTIEILGGVLGLTIGLTQGLFLLLL